MKMGELMKKLTAAAMKYKYVLLVILVGAALLLWPTGTKKADAPQTGGDVFQVAEMEQKLETALSRVSGAGEVTVVLTLREGPRQTLAQDEKTGVQDGERQTETTTVVLSKGTGQEETVTLQTTAPAYQGALVVTSGGADPQVCLQMTQAVSALTGLGANKISICVGK